MDHLDQLLVYRLVELQDQNNISHAVELNQRHAIKTQ